MKTYKAQGSTGIADALAAALQSKVQVTPTRRWSGKTIQTQNLPKQTFTSQPATVQQLSTGYGGKATPPVPSDAYEQRRKREEQAKTISKLSAIIKRSDPRLLAEALQEFGSIEGLNASKQAAFIAKLEGIIKTYQL